MKKVKLFCLPYAGGTSNVYLSWKKYLNSSIDVFPVELAGRGKRFNDHFYSSFYDAIEDTYKIIKDSIEDSSYYALYGHSMGSWLAYEISHKIMDSNINKPIHIFLSGRYAPQKCKREEKHHLLTDDLFIEKVLKLGGTKEEVFKNDCLRNVFLPVLRADYKMTEEYIYYPKKNKLESDITYFFSKDDDITFEEATEWSCHTNGKFITESFEGGHFFINEYTKDVCQIINDTLYFR